MKILFIVVCTILATATTSAQSTADPVQLKYLSDSDIVYQNLEAYQNAIYPERERELRWQNTPKQRQEVIVLCKRLGVDPDSMLNRLNRIILPTRYEDANSYLILLANVADVAAQLRRVNIEYIQPRLGTLPTASLNARTNRTYPDKPLITVNSGIFGFCHEIMKIVFETTAFRANDSVISIDYSKNSLDSIIRNDPHVLVRYSMALEDYANRRRIKGQAVIDTIKSSLIYAMVNAMEFFTVAHEYGHLIFEHTPVDKENAELTLNTAKTDLSFEVAINSWQQEIEADIFAFYLLCEHIKANPSVFDGILQLSPYVFFQLSQIAEEAVYTMKNRKLPLQLTSAEKQKATSAVSAIAVRANEKVKQQFGGLTYVYKPFVNTQTSDTLTSKSHPPSWVRGRLIKSLAEQNKVFADSIFTPLGEGFVENEGGLWDTLKMLWLRIMHDVKPTKDAELLENKVRDGNTDLFSVLQDAFKENPAMLDSFMNEVARDIRKEEPEQCDSLRLKGYDYFEQKRYKESIDLLLQAEACGVKSATFYFVLGRDYLDSYDSKNAIKYFSKAIDKDTARTYHWNYGNRGIAFANLEMYSEALRDLNKAIAMVPDFEPRLYRERAIVYLGMKQYKESIDDYLKALKIDPSNSEYLVELYEAYAIQGDFYSVINGRKNVLKNKPSNELLLIYDFFEYAATVGLGLSTKNLEKEMNKLLQQNYSLIWYFDLFNASLRSYKLSNTQKQRILKMENRVKLTLKSSTRRPN